MYLLRRHLRIMRPVATTVLLLSALVGWGAQAESHCSPGRASPRVAAEHSHHHFAAPTAGERRLSAGHDCDHCSPAECARAAPCAGSAGPALCGTIAPFRLQAARGVDLPSQTGPRPDAVSQPPTPPPQTVS